MDELLATPEGFGDDVPVGPDFHARRLPDAAWRDPGSPFSGGVEAVTQLHRLREVMVLIGFTRFEAAVRDIHGDYESDVQRADIALEPGWYPAVENRGEGVFAHLRPTAVDAWLRRPAVIDRIDGLRQQHNEWRRSRRKPPGGFPGGPYVLLHTLAHLLIQSVAMRCGYPASSIRERIYVESGHYGILLYTGSPDAEGTLGGLVQQARHFEDHLAHALETGSLCSNDPICAQHSASEGFEERWLPRRGLSWMYLDRRDLVRDAQRLPRQGAGGPGARSGRCRLLPFALMYAGHHLQALPPHLLRRLARAFDAGQLPDHPTPKSLESEAGIRDGAEELINDLNQLARVGVSGRAVAA